MEGRRHFGIQHECCVKCTAVACPLRWQGDAARIADDGAQEVPARFALGYPETPKVADHRIEFYSPGQAGCGFSETCGRETRSGVSIRQRVCESRTVATFGLSRSHKRRD